MSIWSPLLANRDVSSHKVRISCLKNPVLMEEIRSNATPKVPPHYWHPQFPQPSLKQWTFRHCSQCLFLMFFGLHADCNVIVKWSPDRWWLCAFQAYSATLVCCQKLMPSKCRQNTGKCILCKTITFLIFIRTYQLCCNKKQQLS